MNRSTRTRNCRERTYAGALCGLIIVVACQIALCSGQVTFGPDHMLFDIDNLPENALNLRSQNSPSRPPARHSSQRHSPEEEDSGRRSLYRKPGSSSRHPSSEEKEHQHNRRPEVHPRHPSSEEEEVERTGTHEVDSHEHVIDSEKHNEEHQETRRNGESEEGRTGVWWSNENNNSSESRIQIEVEDKTGTKTFDTKTFLNGVSILTGEPDPPHCEILDAWACNAEQTKAVCPNRCAELGQAVDAPWCRKDKHEALCNHHDARWMCPSFCAAIDAKDCILFEDWVCKAEKAKKICPERCNNVNFTTDAPWCAQHGDNAGCSWLCMNADANQMCSFFCLLHGFPLIGQNGLPTGIPPGLLNGIPGVSDIQGKYSGIQNTPLMQYGNPGTLKQGMENSQGIPGIGVYEHFLKLKNRQRIIGGIPEGSGGLIGSLRRSQAGTGSQRGYLGSQVVYPRSHTGYIGPQKGFQGIPVDYTESQAGYPVPQTGYANTFPRTVPEYQGAQSGVPGSPIGYQGSSIGYPGSQLASSWESDCSGGSVPGYPEVSPCELQAGIQVAYPEEGVYGTGIQSSYGTGVGGAYATGTDGVYGTEVGGVYDDRSGGAYNAAIGGSYS